MAGGIKGQGMEQDVLAEQINFIKALANNLSTPAFGYDREGIFRWCNPAFAQMMAKTVETIIGRSISEVWSADLVNFHVTHSWDELSDQPRRFSWSMPLPDGTQRELLLHENPIYDTEGVYSGVCGTLADITEQKLLEQQLIRLDQLRVVGEMAANLGHEIRNPMTTVRGFLQFLGEKKECYPYRDYFDLMIEELDRADSIIAEYLAIARDRVGNFSSQNINHLVNRLYPLLLTDAARFEQEIRLELSPENPAIQADPNEIRQLLLNLVRNGLEAMEPGGILIIGTRIESGKQILYVQDQGPGIAAGLIEHLGQPFITTKETGTGLGLAVCYNIANRHQAKVEVESNAKGTTFYIYFDVLAASEL